MKIFRNLLDEINLSDLLYSYYYNKITIKCDEHHRNEYLSIYRDDIMVEMDYISHAVVGKFYLFETILEDYFGYNYSKSKIVIINNISDDSCNFTDVDKNYLANVYLVMLEYMRLQMILLNL